jgi:hypothetical protein
MLLKLQESKQVYGRYKLRNPNFVTLTQPKVAMVVGQGVDPSDAGEIWHLFDRQLCRCLNTDQLQRVDLNKYWSTLILNGNYSDFLQSQNIEQWIQWRNFDCLSR